MEPEEKVVEQLLNNTHAGNGMMTNVWGPAGWVFLHSVTFGYPMDPDAFDHNLEQPVGTTRERYLQFFESCAFVFPCRYCRESYQRFIQEDPVSGSLKDRASLTRWLWRIHERVNEKLGKKGITYEELVRRYETYRATCNKDKKGCSVPLGFSNKQQTCVVVYSEVAITSVLIGLVMLMWLIWIVVIKKQNP
jgi:hypothetical protein